MKGMSTDSKTGLVFRPYISSGYTDCLALFELNCPEFFAEEEREDYKNFLKSNSSQYFQGFIKSNFVCCFGITDHADDACSISWIIVHPSYQKHGCGTAMMSYFLQAAAAMGKRKTLIATSQHAGRFFEKFGAVAKQTIEDGWGKEMHRVDMELAI